MNVIGYKGSEVDRRALWNAMINYKGSHALFKNKVDEREKRMAERDLNRYKAHLTYYIDREAA